MEGIRCGILKEHVIYWCNIVECGLVCVCVCVEREGGRDSFRSGTLSLLDTLQNSRL